MAAKTAPVEVEPAPMGSLAIRFTPQVLEELRARAATEGVGVTQLVRGWTLDRLQAEQLATLPPDVGDALQVLIEHLRTKPKSRSARKSSRS